MPCEPLQTKIAVREPLTPEELRHVETCPDCAAFSAFDANLDARLPQWRSPGSVPALRPISRSNKPRIAFAGLGLAAALTIGFLALPARSTAEGAYRQMIAAVRNVRSVHVIVRWRPVLPVVGRMREAIGLSKQSELWWQPGEWREWHEDALASIKRVEPEGLRFYRYDPKTGTVRSYSERLEPSDYSNFDLSKFAEQFMDKPTRFERPSENQIVALNDGGWSRTIFTIDPASGLPSHAEKQFRTDGDWQTSGTIDLEFNQPVDPARFSPESLRE